MSNLKLIVGLGNPGPDYENTRHNIGFMVLDKIAENNRVKFSFKKDFLGEIANINIKGNKAILLKPHTLMNLSGNSVIKVLNYYKINIEDLIIIVDDINIDLGVLKIRIKGSSGGHNGLKDIQSHLHTSEYKRLRIGISKPNGEKPLNSFVLGRLTKPELAELGETFEKAIYAIYDFICDRPFLDIMSNYNTSRDEKDL